MKTKRILILLALALASGGLVAQNTFPGSATNFPPNEIRRHYKKVEVTLQGTRGFGSQPSTQQFYTVLGNGMGFPDDQGNWQESRPVVQDFGNFIVGTGATYRVVLNANLNTQGAVDLETSDQQRLVSHPLALAFYDPESGRREVLARVKDCTAELFSGNLVVYRDAFEGSGIEANVTYGYKRGRFHQDVTFVRGPSVSPADFNMGSKSRLEVLTEFVESPAPLRTARILKRELDTTKRAQMAEPDLVDEKLNYGKMTMLLGRAFNAESGKRGGTAVAKRLLEIEGRTILVEAIDWNEAQAKLKALPRRASLTPASNERMAVKRELPKRDGNGQAPQSFELRLAQAVQSRSQKPALAAASRIPSGFVLDYELVETADDVTFESGQTYLVEDEVTLGGVTTFESGAVIKYDVGASIVLGDVVCSTSGGKTILTASDDASVGQQIGGYTGTITNYYATEALRFEFVGSDFILQNLDIRHASTGVAIESSPDAPTIFDCRFGRCSVAISELDTWVSVDTVQMCSVTTRYVESGGTGGVSESNVTENCDVDLDGDGMWDSWETTHFGNLNQNGSSDYDGDGLTNFQEFQNTSNPTDYYNGVLPNLTIVGGNNQSGMPDMFLLSPLVVRVTNTNGVMLTNAPLTFAVTLGGAQLATNTSQSPVTTFDVRSATNAQAESLVLLPGSLNSTNYITATAWSGTNSVQVTFAAYTFKGVKLWLRADAGITNSSVNRWSDQSGNIYDATQNTAANRPALVTNTLNGKPVVRFDGANDFLNLPNLLNGTTQAEVFVVLKADVALPGANRGLWKFGTDNSTWVRYPSTDGSIWEDFGSTANYAMGVPAQPLTNYHLFNVSAATGQWAARLNGALQGSRTNTTFAFTTTPTLGKSSYYFDGDVAEVVIYDRVLSTGERNAVNFYLNSKYALVSGTAQPPSNLVAQAISPSQISLKWDGALDQGNTRVSIERKTGVNGTYSAIAEVQNAGSYLNTGMSAGTTYYYRVRAANFIEWTAYSNEANTTTPTEGTEMPLTNMRMWLKADAGLAQLGTNAPVNFWEDQSGRGNHAMEIYTFGASTRPAWVAGQINNRPVVRFDGTDDFFTLYNLLNGATQAEAFVVLKVDVALPAAHRGLWKLGSEAISSWVRYPATDGSIWEDFGSTANYAMGVPAQPLTNYHMYNVSAATGQWLVRVNGAPTGARTNTVFGANASPTLGKSSYYFDGDVAEVVIYDRVLTTAERNAVNVYLNGKYALVSTPSAPSNLVAQAISPGQVSLKWDGDLDQGATRVSIERKTGVGGTYAVVAEVQNARSYLDTGLTAGTTYYYRVRAANFVDWTAYSNEANTTTPTEGTEMPLTNLRLWLKADMGLAQNGTNAPVNFWEDQSGRGNHATEIYSSGAATRPTWVAGQINNRPVVRFDGTDDFLNLANLLNGTTQAEAFVVLKVDVEVPAASKGLWKLGNVGTATWVRYPSTDGAIWEDFGRDSNVNIGDPAQPLTEYHLYNVSARTGEWVARVNSAVQYSTTASTYGYTAAPTLGKSGYYFDGDIAEVMIFGRVLTVTERNAVGDYLTGKYGMAPLRPKPQDRDGDGLTDDIEILVGTDPTVADTDGDGVNDILDAFPLDPSRASIPSSNPSDHTPPNIILSEPTDATLLP